MFGNKAKSHASTLPNGRAVVNNFNRKKAVIVCTGVLASVRFLFSTRRADEQILSQNYFSEVNDHSSKQL